MPSLQTWAPTRAASRASCWAMGWCRWPVHWAGTTNAIAVWPLPTSVWRWCTTPATSTCCRAQRCSACCGSGWLELGRLAARAASASGVIQQVGLEVVPIQPGALAQRIAAGEPGVALLLLGSIGQMVAHLAATAHQLHLARARLPDLLVALQCVRHRCAIRAPQAGGEHERVFSG